jgi:phosphoribosyl 1,2-cyclic phosphate phosphodiesterase
MKITFLGTGTSQGVPVIACKCQVCLSADSNDKRLRSSVLIESGEKQVVIDAGPDFRQQMLRSDVESLDAIIITHEHKDHIGGLDDIRAFNYQTKKPMDVYASLRAIEVIQCEYPYAFSERKYPGIPEFNLITITEAEFTISGLKFTPISGLHYHLPVFGYRHENFAYLCDFSYILPSEKEKLFGLDVLVLNALRKKPHYSHFNLDEALELIRELKPKKAYLTHISHLMGLHLETEKELPANVHLSYDNLSIEI